MEKNTVLLQDTEAFMHGELDNVTVQQNCIVLDLVQGGYVPYGCYTSAPIPMPLFDALRVSWNAASPEDTAVEAQARVMVDGMKALGLMKGNTEDAVREGAHALFYPHGLGHMMGLDVHDMENLGEIWVGYNGQPKSTQFGRKSQRLAIPLEPGFVHTVEPGIYFIPELIDMWKAEKKFTDFINYDVVETYKDFGGIRNEEDYLITETGARRLGKKIPLTPEEVEALR